MELQSNMERFDLVERSAVAIRIGGTFDVSSARRVSEEIAESVGERTVHLDLTQVREFHDSALVLLSAALARIGPRASVSGLRHHQARILRYLGVRVDDAPELAAAVD
jgi:anti-anti-sigma regulatory factor